MKRIKIALVIVVLAVPSAASSQINPFAEFYLDLQLSYPPVKKISNVPNLMRDVPIHPDDPWGTPGAIAADKANAPWLWEIRFLKLGLETKFSESVIWKNYADLSFNFGYWTLTGGQVRERNYTNAVGTDQRGYGAALTFWSPDYDLLIPGFRSELYFPRKNTNGFFGDSSYWFLGAGFRRFDCSVVTGYDRWDSLDFKDHYKLGDIWETSAYIGVSTGSNSEDHWFADARFGLNVNVLTKKQEYKDVNVDMNPITPFVALSCGYRF